MATWADIQSWELSHALGRERLRVGGVFVSEGWR